VDQERTQEKERAQRLQEILGSKAFRKLVVAGPGTGKSFTFKELLKTVGTDDNLALTFINLLAADLATALAGLAEAKTFHSFCRGLLHKRPAAGLTVNFSYYPQLGFIQEDDLRILGRNGVDRSAIEQRFHSLDDSDGIIFDAIKSGNTWDAVGHTDAVFRVLRELRLRPDATPRFGQIVVDEYQDFSRLETEFIDLLATYSPTLVAGDDDQALYGFKGASPDFIRAAFDSGEWETFELPFCSRCTEVIVAATHDVVARAVESGLLTDRLPKRYDCYLPEKEVDSQKHPKIIHASCSVDRKGSPYPARYIAHSIAGLPAADIEDSWARSEPTALVLGPGHLLTSVAAELETSRAIVSFNPAERAHVEAWHGLRVLLENPTAPLGWRILLQTEKPDGWEEIVSDALAGKDLESLTRAEFKARWLALAEKVRQARQIQPIPLDISDDVREAVGIEVEELFARLGWTEPIETPEPDKTRPRVTLTTLTGAKGLQARHVFVLGMNEGVFPRSNDAVTDLEVCQLIVALTRTKSQCTLISVGNYAGKWMKPSVFLDWLSGRIATTKVDKTFFE